jgi:tetratricopeptide (TPR) repeat protein
MLQAYDLADGLVRIVNADKETIGTGLVLEKGRILTANHVVVDAGKGMPANKGIWFEFLGERLYKIGGKNSPVFHRAVVDISHVDEKRDVAFLLFSVSMPPGVKSYPLNKPDSDSGEVFVSGFGGEREEHEDLRDSYNHRRVRTESYGITIDNGFETIHLDQKEIRPGYSGGPVLSVTTGNIIGIVLWVEAHSGSTQGAFVRTTNEIKVAYPELKFGDAFTKLEQSIIGHSASAENRLREYCREVVGHYDSGDREEIKNYFPVFVNEQVDDELDFSSGTDGSKKGDGNSGDNDETEQSISDELKQLTSRRKRVTLTDHIEQNPRIFVRASLGSGKSITLKKIEWDNCNLNQDWERENKIIPIRVLAQEFGKGRDLKRMVLRKIVAPEDSDAFLLAVLRIPGVVVLIDGLNELTDPTLREQLLAEIKGLIGYVPRMRCVLTTRFQQTDKFDYSQNIEGSFKTVDINPLRRGELRDAIACLDLPEKKKKGIITHLKERGSNIDILLTPLYLTMWVNLYRDKETFIPLTQVELFETFVREKISKERVWKSETSVVLRCLQLLGYAAIGKPSLSLKDIEKLLTEAKVFNSFSEIATFVGHAKAANVLRPYVDNQEEDNELMPWESQSNVGGGERVDFYHDAFKEYFAAKHIFEDLRNNDFSSFLPEVSLSDEEWFQPLVMTSELVGDNEEKYIRKLRLDRGSTPTDYDYEQGKWSRFYKLLLEAVQETMPPALARLRIRFDSGKEADLPFLNNLTATIIGQRFHRLPDSDLRKREEQRYSTFFTTWEILYFQGYKVASPASVLAMSGQVNISSLELRVITERRFISLWSYNSRLNDNLLNQEIYNNDNFPKSTVGDSIDEEENKKQVVEISELVNQIDKAKKEVKDQYQHLLKRNQEDVAQRVEEYVNNLYFPEAVYGFLEKLRNEIGPLPNHASTENRREVENKGTYLYLEEYRLLRSKLLERIVEQNMSVAKEIYAAKFDAEVLLAISLHDEEFFINELKNIENREELNEVTPANVRLFGFEELKEKNIESFQKNKTLFLAKRIVYLHHKTRLSQAGDIFYADSIDALIRVYYRVTGELSPAFIERVETLFDRRLTTKDITSDNTAWLKLIEDFGHNESQLSYIADTYAVTYKRIYKKGSGHKEAAIDLLKRAVAQRNNNPHLLPELSQAYHHVGNHRDAIKVLKDQIERYGYDYKTVSQLVRYSLESADKDKTEKDGLLATALHHLVTYEKEVAFDPQVTSLHGYYYFKVGEYLKAIPYYERAIVDQPKSDQLYGTLANCYEKTKQYLKAIDMLEREQVLKPTSVKSYVILGRIKKILRKDQEAVDVYQKALEVARKKGADKSVKIVLRSLLDIHLSSNDVDTELGQLIEWADELDEYDVGKKEFASILSAFWLTIAFEVDETQLPRCLEKARNCIQKTIIATTQRQLVENTIGRLRDCGKNIQASKLTDVLVQKFNRELMYVEWSVNLNRINGDVEGTQRALQRMYQRGKEVGRHDDELALMARELAAHFYENELWDKEIRNLHLQLSHLDKLNDSEKNFKERSITLTRIADAYLKVGDLDSAFEHYEKALLPNKRFRAPITCYINYADALVEIEEYEKALFEYSWAVGRVSGMLFHSCIKKINAIRSPSRYDTYHSDDFIDGNRTLSLFEKRLNMNFNTAVFYNYDEMNSDWKGKKPLPVKDYHARIASHEGIEKISFQRAYGNWSNGSLKEVSKILTELGVDQSHTGNTSNKKVATLLIAIDVMNVVHENKNIDFVVVVGRSAELMYLKTELARLGVEMINAYPKDKALASLSKDKTVFVDISKNLGKKQTESVEKPLAKNFTERIQKFVKDKVKQKEFDVPRGVKKLKAIRKLFHDIAAYPAFKADIDSENFRSNNVVEILKATSQSFSYQDLGHLAFSPYIRMVCHETPLAMYVHKEKPALLIVGYRKKEYVDYRQIEDTSMPNAEVYRNIIAEFDKSRLLPPLVKLEAIGEALFSSTLKFRSMANWSNELFENLNENHSNPEPEEYEKSDIDAVIKNLKHTGALHTQDILDAAEGEPKEELKLNTELFQDFHAWQQNMALMADKKIFEFLDMPLDEDVFSTII